MNRVLPIPNLTSLIAATWCSAEAQTREELATSFWDRDEEFITGLFHGRFHDHCAAQTREVEQAFLKDLRLHFRNPFWSSQLRRLASGIGATVTLHSREIEKHTGGDLGLLLIRPNLRPDGIDAQKWLVEENYRRGLLCQAKIMRRGGRWGSFRPNQRKVLSDKLWYLALLLYEYDDPERRRLRSFNWQVCGPKVDFNDVSLWLKSARFPSLSGSDEIIRSLGSDKIGTDSADIIDQIIAPPARPALIVRIGWPPDSPPPGFIYLPHSAHQSQSQNVHRRL